MSSCFRLEIPLVVFFHPRMPAPKLPKTGSTKLPKRKAQNYPGACNRVVVVVVVVIVVVVITIAVVHLLN